MGTTVVVLTREQEAGKLVHWAGLLARAQANDVVALCVSATDGDPGETEIDLEGEVPTDGLLGGAATAIGRTREFLAGLRMQEHREIPADPAVTQCNEFVRRRTHDAPVPLRVLDTELFVTNSATDEVDLHRAILPDC